MDVTRVERADQAERMRWIWSERFMMSGRGSSGTRESWIKVMAERTSQNERSGRGRVGDPAGAYAKVEEREKPAEWTWWAAIDRETTSGSAAGRSSGVRRTDVWPAERVAGDEQVREEKSEWSFQSG